MTCLALPSFGYAVTVSVYTRFIASALIGTLVMLRFVSCDRYFVPLASAIRML